MKADLTAGGLPCREDPTGLTLMLLPSLPPLPLLLIFLLPLFLLLLLLLVLLVLILLLVLLVLFFLLVLLILLILLFLIFLLLLLAGLKIPPLSMFSFCRGAIDPCTVSSITAPIAECVRVTGAAVTVVVVMVVVAVVMVMMVACWQRGYWFACSDRLSSVTGILGWIIRITLLLLKNTRS